MVSLIVAISAIAIASLDAQGLPSRHYKSARECGFEFDYPADWVVESIPKERCRVRLRPRDFAERMKETDIDYYTLDVGPQDGRFLVVADDNLFDFFKGKWVVRGRHGIASEADVVSNTRWHGVRGVGAAGCFHEAGGYAGLCERLVVVLQDDDENIWSMGGGQASEHVFETILATFRFVR